MICSAIACLLYDAFIWTNTGSFAIQVKIHWKLKQITITYIEENAFHYDDVITSAIASHITSLTIVYSIVYSDTDKKTSKLRVTGLCVGNSPGTGELPAQMASYAENVSIWWRHHVNLSAVKRQPFCPGPKASKYNQIERSNFIKISFHRCN